MKFILNFKSLLAVFNMFVTMGDRFNKLMSLFPPNKNCMSYIKGLVCNYSQNYGHLFSFCFELHLPSNWTILPPRMHTIKACKHVWKTLFYIKIELNFYIYSHGYSKAPLLKNYNYDMHMSFHIFHCCILGKLRIFIFCISPCSIYKHAK